MVKSAESAQQIKKLAEETRHHGKSYDDKKGAADHIDDTVVLFDEVECGFEMVDENGACHKGNSEAEGIAEEHEDTLENAALLRSEHESGSEKCADTGSPAYGEHDAENHSGYESHAVRDFSSAEAFENAELKDAEEIETEEDYDQPGDDVDGCLVSAEK